MNQTHRQCVRALSLLATLAVGLEAIALEHPSLALTPDQIKLARSRAEGEPWAKALVAGLVGDADKAMGAELPSFDREWWTRTGKDMEWGDTYPEVNYHTGQVPRPPAARAWNLALAYALTGREEFGDEAARILTHFAREYTFEIDHYDVGLNTATWGLPLLHVLDVAWDLVDAETLALLRIWFLEMGEHVLDHDREWVAHGWGGAFNNHYAWHKRLLAEVGLMFDRPEWIEYAIRSSMGVADLLENGILDGGMWLESSSNYHFTTLHALAPLAQAFRNVGHPLDLFTHEFRGGASLKQLFTGPLMLARPDLSMVPVGDCYGRVIQLDQVASYEQASAVYEDPVLDWLVAQGRARVAEGSVERLLYGKAEPSGQAPGVGSQILREHGWALLRGLDEDGRYWHSSALSLFCTWDLSGIHANADALSFQLHGFGRPLLIDAEASAQGHVFSSDVQRELNRHTVCHNTVMVDVANQNPNHDLLTLESVDITPGHQSIIISDPEGVLYEGVTQRRSLVLTSEGVADRFELTSQGEHQYDYLLHWPAGSSVDLNVTLEQTEFTWEPASRWLRDPRVGATDGPIRARVAIGDAVAELEVQPCPGTEVLIAEFPTSADHSTAPSLVLMVRRRATSTVFESRLTMSGQG